MPSASATAAGMLAARAAEAGERVAGDVMASRDRDLADRGGHIVDRDVEETLRRFPRGSWSPPSWSAISCSRARDASAIERLVAVRPEHRREMRRVDPPEEQVAVGDRQRTAVAVAGGSRVRAGALRPDAEAHSVEPADRPAAGRDGVDLHHRRADANAGDDAFVGKLELPGIMRHVGRRAAHVEADQPLGSVRRARRDHADHAAGRVRTGSRPCRETRWLRRGRRSTA